MALLEGRGGWLPGLIREDRDHRHIEESQMEGGPWYLRELG